MKHWFHRFIQWTTTIWPATIWSVFVFLLLVIPLKRETEASFFSIPHFDKAIHLFLFSALSFLWHQYLSIKQGNTNLTKIISLFVIVVLYGVIIEYIQDWTGRDFDPLDMVANTAGALIGVIIKKSRTDIVRD